MPATRREAPFSIRVMLPGGVWPGDRGGGEPVRELTLRAVGGEDEAFILDSGGALPSARATALLARCLEDGERVAPALTVGDREALLLHLRRLTLGETMDCVLHCPAAACGEPLDLALGVSDLLLAPYREVRSRYDLSLDVEGARYDVAFRLPTAEDLDRTAVLARSDPPRAAAEILRRCIEDAGRNGAALDAAALPEAVCAAVAAAMAERDPQAELELDLRCPACGAAFSLLFDTAAFLLRELEERAAGLLREVHALAVHYHWSEAEILRLPSRRRARYFALVTEAQAAARVR